MRILITRPIEDARPLADALEQRGVEVLIEPLLEIRHLEDAEIDLEGVQALLFTSANGVRAFAAVSPRRDLKALTVGDGSADAARHAGFTDVDPFFVQRFDLSNFLMWLRDRRPSGLARLKVNPILNAAFRESLAPAETRAPGATRTWTMSPGMGARNRYAPLCSRARSASRTATCNSSNTSTS